MSAVSTNIVWHPGAFEEIARSHGVAHGLDTVAGKAADEMSRTAPRGSGEHMADHIETASGVDAEGPYTDIGIATRRFFYWRFLENGTERMSARPFIRPALKKHYTV